MNTTSSPGQQSMRVIAKDPLADGVVALRLADAAGGSVPMWEPGSHIDLVLDTSMTRQYSLCGDPSDTSTLTVAVLREGSGRGGSIHVHDKLETGDVIEIGGPRNHFALVEAESYVFVAGGIGITPLLPMLRAAQARGANWRLLYGGRTRGSMAFADELAEEFGENVSLRPQDEYGILDLASALDAAAPGTAVYCCGPEPLLQAIEAVCREREHLNLHIERFSPKQREEGAVDDAFDVELARSGRTIGVGADESIIDALQRGGVTVDFSCREGTCGTCEVAVLGGKPDHRDSILTEEEQEAGDAMMICVSRSRTPKLVIDL